MSVNKIMEQSASLPRRFQVALMLLFFLLLMITGPVIIASFIWASRMTGSIVTVVVAMVYVSLYIYAIRKYG